jgi:hypothetical protein
MTVPAKLGVVFAALLHEHDARRATDVLEAVLAHHLRCALTGGPAIDWQLGVHGHHVERRPLNDIDLVVEGFASIPESLAGSFLLNHVHPHAAEGKTLLQLIDRTRAVRVDLFRAFGKTLSRAATLDETSCLNVLAVEDLVVRTTALVCGRLRRGRSVDIKHATMFARLLGLGRHQQLAAAWIDHRQEVPGTLQEATREAARLLRAHPELVVVGKYSTDITPCEQCQEHGPFRPAPPETVVEILGYW